MRRSVVFALVLALVAACSSSTPPTPSPGPSVAAEPETVLLPEARVTISPGAALLTALGQSRTLSARAVDAVGNPAAGSVTWTSSDPATVSVAADGTITAVAPGAAQLVAEIGGIASAPALVLVAQPAAGVKLVDDAQVVALEGLDTNTYRLTVQDLGLQVGDLVAGTGEKPIAGRVTALDGSAATVDLVPLDQLLPTLAVDEAIDLSNAPIRLRADVAALFDVARAGDTLTFTPKPNFMELLAAARAGADMRPVAHRGGRTSGVALAAPTGTSALPPFEECETSLTGVDGALPLQLSDPPSFSMTISPSLEIVKTPEDELLRWLIRGNPKATLNLGIRINAQIEGKIECKHTFYEYVAPVFGVLSFVVAGLVPIGMGFSLGGKVVLASAVLGGKAEASASVALGVECAGGACEFAKAMSDVKVDPQWTFEAPSVGNIRLQPSFEVFGFVKGKVGSPLLSQLGLDFATAKVGGTFGADWAPRITQMTDQGYRSEYKISLAAGVAVGVQLGELAERLGVGSINALSLDLSTDLYHSPTAQVRLDKSSYAIGDTGMATIKFAPPENLTLLGLDYNVDRLVLAVHNPASDLGYDELAVVTATDGQREFQVPFTAIHPTAAGDVYAFVIPRYLSLADELALELERVGRVRLGLLQNGAAVAIDPDGANPGPLTLGAFSPPSPLAVASPSGRSWAYVNGGDLWIADADGLNARRVGPGNSRWAELQFLSVAWSPDERRVAYTQNLTQGQASTLVIAAADGSSSTSIAAPTNGTDFGAPSWSPDGSRIAVENFSTIYVVDPATNAISPLTPVAAGCSTCLLYFDPVWSPDSAQLAAISVGRTGSPAKTNVVLLEADGSDPVPITPDIGLFVRVTPMSWSSEGIVFTQSRVTGNVASYQVWAVNPDGSNLRPLAGPLATIPAPYWFSQP